MFVTRSSITFLGHALVVMASHDTDGIINTTIVLLVQDDQTEIQHDFLIHLTL